MRTVCLKDVRNGDARQGSVLVLVLIIVTSLTILSVGLAHRTRIEIKLAGANARRVQAYYLALGGVERVKALVSQRELSPSTVALICQFGGTAKEEGLFEQVKASDFAESSLAYSLRDEQGYLNINKSDPASWENIGCISRVCRASILDWIDADDDVSADGAESDFYERLEPAYVSKNKPYIVLRELLFTKAVGRGAYMGEDLNRNSLLDDSERDGLLSLPPDNEDSRLDAGLVDVFTIYGDGRININTASGTILSALPGLDEYAAGIVLTYRAGPDGRSGTDDDVCFESAEDCAKAEGLTELQVELLRQYCNFNSKYFRVFSHASTQKGFECSLMVTVKYTEDGLRVVCFERLL